MINVNQVASQLARMPDQALQQFATMHKDDPYTLSMALSESNRRKEMRTSAQAQGGEQPKVVDQFIQSMGSEQAPPQPMPQPMPQQPQPAQAGRQLPEEQGIGALPAPNMQGMADGGIVGFAEGKRVFSADKYLKDPRVQRFLEYINKYEGSPKENQTVGYHQFDDLSKHPNRRVKFNKRGDKSTAAGAYQIINHTWQDQAKKQGLEDFSLENQKRAAIGVLQETGALDALMNNDIEKAKQRAARAWASIPGSTLGESTGQKAKFNPRAEQVLADITPQKVAETKKPAPAPVRAAERQETVGLSPERARQINEALPFATARAEDGIPALIKKEATGKTKDLTAKPEDRRAPLPASAAPAKPAKPAKPTGIQALVDDGPVDPMGNVPYTEQVAPRAQSGTKSPVTSVLAAGVDLIPNTITGALSEVSRVALRPFMSSDEADVARRVGAKVINPVGKLLGVSQDPAYQQAPTQQVLDQMSKYLGMSAKQISETSGMSVSDAESIQNMLLMFGPKVASKVANIKQQSNMPVRPGTPTKSGAAPLMSEGELALRQAQAEAAQNAARRNASPAQGELFDKIQAPIPAGVPKTPLGAAMETAVKDNRRSEQMSLFPPEELPVPPAIDRVLKPRNEALEAARSANEKRALAGEDVRPVQQRLAENRQKILDTKAIKARELADIAKTQVIRQGEKPSAGPTVRERFVAEADKGKYVIPGALAASETVKDEPLPYEPNVAGFDRNRGAGETYEKDFVGTGTPVVKPEVPIEERSRIEPKAEAKKSSGFSDEDMLMLGLNLMAGKSQYALSNLGEAGIATLGAKRAREKLAADKEQRDIMGEYYKRLSGTLGTSAEERMIAQVMKEEKIPYAAAIERISGAKYAPRAETTERDFMKQYEALAKSSPIFLMDNPDAAAWVQNQMKMRELTTSGSPNIAKVPRFVGYEGQQ